MHFAWEAGRRVKRVIFSCLLHDWTLYIMGLSIPSIHLVSSFITQFPLLLYHVFRLLHSPVKLGQTTGDEVGVGLVIQI